MNTNSTFFAPAKYPARFVHEDYVDAGHTRYEHLHESTEPDRIARCHAREVEQAWRDGLRDPAAISDRTDLPLCNVLRWLVVLKYLPATSIKTEWWRYDPEVRARYPKRSRLIVKSSR